MLLSLVLLSLTAPSDELKFYESAGSLTADDVSPRDCYMGNMDYRCMHIEACKFIHGLESACSRIAGRKIAVKAAQEAAQFDDYRSQIVATSNPYFVTELRNMTVTEGETINLRCVASGNPIPRVAISTMQMYRKLRYVNRHRRRNSGTAYRDVHSEFTIFDITKANEGWYRCAARNSHDYLISDMYLTVETNPCLGVQCEGLTVCVNVAGVGECQCPSVQSCSEEPLHPVCGNDCVSYFNLCTMKVQACETGDNITIWQDSLCPTIETPQVNRLSTKMLVQAGASLRLKCGARGLPNPDVAWYRVARKGLELVSEKDLLEVKNVKTDQSGKYVCMATNCLHKSIRSNVVNVDVLQLHSSERKVCHVFGDPHVTTFDGSMYSFVGSCEYVLTMDCGKDPKWFVYGRVRPCGKDSSCLQSITVISDGTAIQFMQGWLVNNNGTEEFIAPGGEVTIGTQTITYDKEGLVYTITIPRYGIAVTWDGFSSATIIAHKPLESCGLCGSYEGNNGNDVERSWFSGYYNNVVMSDDSTSERVGSWKIDYYSRQCPATVAHAGAPITNTCMDETEELIVEEECRKVLEGDAFSHCMQSDAQIEFYTRACIRDTCGHDSEYSFCEFIGSIKQHCEQDTQIPVRVELERCPDKSSWKVEMMNLVL